MDDNKKIYVGSRKSELALIQTRYVISLLKEIHPKLDFEIVTMNTLGDKVLDKPLPKIGEKSLFTKELETSLDTGVVDFVVHSLKDLPTTLPPRMVIGAVLAREDPRDALVLQKDLNNCVQLENLPKGSVIGTSSLRRTAQLTKKYPHLKVESIRGNLNTRLRKLDELGKFQGLILAASGLIRMGWQNRISKILNCDEILYAVGQGALAVECRESDEKIIDLLRPLYDLETCIRVIAERSFLKTLGGGCSAPVAVSTCIKSIENKIQIIELTGAVWSLDGKEEIIEKDFINLDIPNMLKCCLNCPYKNDLTTITNECGDIENILCNKNYPSSSANKRLKLDDHSQIPSELLNDDECPINLPIGAEFMGKCPYLESNEKEFIDLTKAKQCPFYNKKIQETKANTSKETKTFCGLVSHERLTIKAMESLLDLGVKLAKSLMEKGATDVMAKAQSIIHNENVTTLS